MRSATVAIVAFMLGLVVTVSVPAADDKEDDTKRIQGTWVVDPAMYKEVKDKEALKEVRFIFEGDTFTLQHPPANKEKGGFRLDPTKNPKQIDMSDAARGIYELDGDTLKLCWDQRGKDNGRPAEFAHDKEKDTVHYFVLKREKPAAPPGAEEKKKDKFDPAAIVGKWKFTEGTTAGEKVEAKKLEGDLTFTITKDTITIEGGGDKHVMKFKIDASKTPIQIDLEATEGVLAGSKGEGIIALDGETMKLAYVTNIPDGKRPEKFESTKDNKASYFFVLKKAK